MVKFFSSRTFLKSHVLENLQYYLESVDQVKILRETFFLRFLKTFFHYFKMRKMKKTNLKHIFQIAPFEQLCHEEYPWIDYLYGPHVLASDQKVNKGKAIDYVNGVRFQCSKVN